MAPAALPAWNVLSTRWPVNDAPNAASAVGRSRISPTAMTSGSCLINDRTPAARSKPTAGFTCDWATPATAISIGSSRLARLRLPSDFATSSRRQA